MPSLELKLEQCADTYLKSVRLDLHFQGVIGVEPEVGPAFDVLDMLPEIPRVDGMSMPGTGAAYLSSLVRASAYDTPVPRDYPVTWENIGGSLRVTVELDRLPPRTPWKMSVPGDVVLVAADDNTADTILVTWGASAEGIPGLTTGTLTLPVRNASVAETLTRMTRNTN